MNPNNNPVCNKKITASCEFLSFSSHSHVAYAVADGGNSVEVTVTDRCTGCDVTSLDFTPTAFQNLASLGTGRIHDMTWVWS